MNEFKKGDRVVVIQDNEGSGGDDWAIGKEFIFEYYNGDGYCEVTDPSDPKPGTYLFGEYQLELVD